MSEEAYRKNVSDMTEDTILVIDPDMVQIGEANHAPKKYRVPATRIAERLGKRIVANMVLVDAMRGLIEMIDTTSVEKAIAKYTHRGTETLNAQRQRVQGRLRARPRPLPRESSRCATNPIIASVLRACQTWNEPGAVLV